jgi:hypothetical protein
MMMTILHVFYMYIEYVYSLSGEMDVYRTFASSTRERTKATRTNTGCCRRWNAESVVPVLTRISLRNFLLQEEFLSSKVQQLVYIFCRRNAAGKCLGNCRGTWYQVFLQLCLQPPGFNSCMQRGSISQSHKDQQNLINV